MTTILIVVGVWLSAGTIVTEIFLTWLAHYASVDYAAIYGHNKNALMAYWVRVVLWPIVLADLLLRIILRRIR